MKLFMLVLAFLVVGVSSAFAGETAVWRYNRHSDQPPFPLSERAQSVWASGACWSECGSHCTWGIAACLIHDTQGNCLEKGDTCDRYCQRTCRTSGGPWVPDIFDF
jgi:hypothetical protein